MPAQDFTNQLIIKVGGAKLPDDLMPLLVHGIIDDSRAVPDMVVLRFRDQDHVLLEKAGIEIGSPLSVAVVSNETTTPEPLVDGEVTALEKEFDGTGSFTTVRGLDKSHRLQRGRRVAAFRQMSAADVAKKVASAAGLKVTADASAAVVEQISQGNVSDWELLRQLASDIGAEVAVVKDTLEFRMPTEAADAPGATSKALEEPLVLELGQNLLRLRAIVTSASQVPEVQVRGWDTAQKRAVVGKAATKTVSAENGVKPADLAQKFAAPALVATDTPYGTQGEVDAAAKALAEQVSGGYTEVEGTMRGNPKVKAGTAVALAGVGKPFEGKYTVTASRHVFDPDTGYTTSFTVSGAQDRTLAGLVAGGGHSAASRRFHGVVIGQVSDNNDPLELGRVKVTFPWLSEDFVSDWARTVQLGAGSLRGAMILPEVGDEVLIAFEQGDFARPYILGGLYNGIDKPPTSPTPLVDKSSGAVNRRDFVSRTGHRLEFLEDAAGAQGVKVSTGDGKVTVDLDQKQTRVTVHSDGSVLVEAKNGVTIDAGTGSLKLAGQDITLSAKAGITLDAGAGGVKATGSTVSLSGSATAELKAGATCTISGALVRIN